MIRFLGPTQPGIAGIILTVYIADLRMSRCRQRREEHVDGFSGASDVVAHFLDMEMEGVAHDLSDRESHNSVSGGRQHTAFHNLKEIGKITQQINNLTPLIIGHQRL